jgi:hypothetical protein
MIVRKFMTTNFNPWKVKTQSGPASVQLCYCRFGSWVKNEIKKVVPFSFSFFCWWRSSSWDWRHQILQGWPPACILVEIKTAFGSVPWRTITFNCILQMNALLTRDVAKVIKQHC